MKIKKNNNEVKFKKWKFNKSIALIKVTVNFTMYHRQQNKCYPEGVYLSIAKIH